MSLETSASFVESSELHRDTGTDSDKGGESAFVEGEGSFFLVDGFGGFESVGVLGCCLQTDLYDIEWLACLVLVELDIKLADGRLIERYFVIPPHFLKARDIKLSN